MKNSQGGFYLDSDEDSESGEDSEDPMEKGTPKKRLKKVSLRNLKDKNRKKFRNSIRRLHPPPSSLPPKNIDFSSFLCVSSPIFYLTIAFLFRVLLFFTEIFL